MYYAYVRLNYKIFDSDLLAKDVFTFPKRATSLQIWSQNTPGQKTYLILFENNNIYFIS